MLRFWLRDFHMGANFKKREHFYKKQFTLPVMFSIPIAITEEIWVTACSLATHLLLPLCREILILCLCRQSVSMVTVTNVSWPHNRMAKDENARWEAVLKMIIKNKEKPQALVGVTRHNREKGNGVVVRWSGSLYVYIYSHNYFASWSCFAETFL